MRSANSPLYRSRFVGISDSGFLGALLLLLLPWVADELPADTGAEAQPLQLTQVEHDPETSTLRYTVTNQSSRTMTAWRVDITKSDARGPLTTSSDIEELIEQPDRRLEPGMQRTITSFLGLADDETFETEIRFVIFDDGTWWGDASEVQVVLENRRLQRQIYQALLETLLDTDTLSEARSAFMELSSIAPKGSVDRTSRHLGPKVQLGALAELYGAQLIDPVDAMRAHPMRPHMSRGQLRDLLEEKVRLLEREKPAFDQDRAAIERPKADGLRIVNVGYDPDLKKLTFGLENATNHLVTAWSVEYAATDDLGNSIIHGEGGDFFAAPDVQLTPGDVWMHRTDIELDGDLDLDSLDVGLRFAILADETIVGDETLGQATLLSRRAQTAAAVWIEERLSTAGTIGEAVEALSSLEELCAGKLRRGHSTGSFDDEFCAFALSDAGVYLELLDSSSASAGDRPMPLTHVLQLATRRVEEFEKAYDSLDTHLSAVPGA